MLSTTTAVPPHRLQPAMAGEIAAHTPVALPASAPDVFFSGEPEPASASPEAAAKKMGLMGVVKGVWGHLRHEDSQPILRGWMYKYGAAAMVPLLFMVPVVGWMAGLAAMPVAWHFSNKGEKMLAEMKANGKMNSKQNPFHTAQEITDIWEDKKCGDRVHELKNKLNDLINHVFPGEDCQKLRERLQLKENSTTLKWLNKLVNARTVFKNHWLLKIISWPMEKLRKLNLSRPLMALLLLPEIVAIGIMTLMGVKPRDADIKPSTQPTSDPAAK